MCGIAGLVDFSRDLRADRGLIERMTASVSHRGPDQLGHWDSEHAAFGHRRLSVIDPANGLQPMIHEQDGARWVITYNGELYNFRELRRELSGRGHSFRTQSDTEVLLHAYLEWGERCVERFNGIFAFGLWDDRKRQLLLARDHMGVKPLYYTRVGETFLFGSEMKALFAHPDTPREIDLDGLSDLVVGVGCRAPGSAFYRGIRELRPAHLMVVRPDGIEERRYWSLESAPHPDDLDTTLEKLSALLDDDVCRQMIADVPVVSMLSGGLDSSGIAAIAQREYRREGKRLGTYSIDFVDSAEHFQSQTMQTSLDEPWAQRVAQHIGSAHRTVTANVSQLVDDFLLPMRAFDVPAGGQRDTSLYLLCKEMKQDATVALSGESADEVFMGYPWFHTPEAINATTFPWMAMMRKEIPIFDDWMSPELRTKLAPEAYLARRYQAALAEVPRLAGEDPENARMREISYFNLTRFLPMLLDRKDRMSMAVGFEVRVPFCDYRLVQYAWNIPYAMKRVGDIEKGILRRAFADLLPEDARMRRKSGFPYIQHPGYLSAMREWAMGIVMDPNAPVRPLVDIGTLRAIGEGKVQLPIPIAMMFFERIIHLDTWLKEYRVSIRE